ncbi:MAG: exonuclease SbcD [Polaribacter sp.]|jgi:exonuclease SbcD
MTILHFSDTHLGYNELDRVTANGVNLREQDFYDSFTQVIDEAIERRPDVVIHSGDFFHRPSPANRPMIVALEQVQRLSNEGIPIVIIAGNHETPRTIYTSPILQAFRAIKGVYPIFNQSYEQIEIGDLFVHGLPHINDGKVLLEEMDRMKAVPGKLNIMMLHTSIGKEYLMEEYGEQLYPKERMDVLNEFDYVALGHWHNFQKVSKLTNGWYSGSTERMSDTEAGKEKGYCMLNLEKGKVCPPEFIPIKTRNWFRLDIKDCHEKEVEAIEEELVAYTENNVLTEGLLNLYLHDIKTTQSIILSNRKVYELMPEAVHIQVKRTFMTELNQFDYQQQEHESLEKQMTSFISEEFPDEATANTIAEKAQEYFDLYETGEYKNR